jgi:hypothetical protein
MLQKKPSPLSLGPVRRKLQALYARRQAIDELIRSLEQYDRYRVRTTEIDKRKSA